MSNEELAGHSASELNEFRKEIVSGSQMAVNATGYYKVVVERELQRVNDLILKKTAH